jgi:uncharacterized membrane protein YfcA
MTWQLVLTGLLVGSLVGVTGVGGGSLMTPILIVVFGFQPTVAVGTDILHGAVSKSFGTLRHRRLGTVDARLALWMLAGSAPLSLAGVVVSGALGRRYGDGAQLLEKHVIGGALVVCGLGFLAKALLGGRGGVAAPVALTARRRVAALAIGVVGGFLVGLTSVGSGTFFGLAMLALFPMSAARIVGTDIFQAAILLWVAGAGHLVAGNVDLHAIGWLLCGSVPGIVAASRLTVKLPDRAIRLALAATLVLSGVKLSDLPASSWIVLTGLATGIVALTGAGLRSLASSPLARRGMRASQDAA